MEHSITLEIPLNTVEQASMIFQTLNPDPELKPDEFTKTLVQEDTKIIAEFSGVTERTLRVGVNSFMDSLGEALECLSTFDPAYYK